MKQKLLLILSLAASSFILMSFSAYSQDVTTDTTASPGRQQFYKGKCNNCHSISCAGITAKTKNTSKTGPPDLSGVGGTYKYDFLSQFLKKDATLGDKKHPIKFNGTDEDLTTLTKWLTEFRSGTGSDQNPAGGEK